jgi:hypothetical protein
MLKINTVTMEEKIEEIILMVSKGEMGNYEAIKELLKLFDVSQQRELLLDFSYWWFKDLHPADATKIVSKYIGNKSNNCG